MKKTLVFALLSVCACLGPSLLISCGNDTDETPAEVYGSVSGTITSVATGEGIPGATVAVVSEGLETTTGSDGSYLFSKVKVGTTQVSASASGYNNSSKSVVVAASTTSEANIQLSFNSTAISLSPLSLNFGPTVSQLTFTVKNATSTDLPYTVTAMESFITVQPGASVVPANGAQTLTVSINRTNITSNINTQLTVNVGSNSYSLSININASK